MSLFLWRDMSLGIDTPELVVEGLLPYSVNLADFKSFVEKVDSRYGLQGVQGINLGMNALETMSQRREMMLDPKTGLHVPFIFDATNPNDGYFYGFRKAFTGYAEDYDVLINGAIDSLPEEPTTCALHLASDLWMYVEQRAPRRGELDRVMFASAKILSFTITNEDE